jgi:predicted dehydrogenase
MNKARVVIIGLGHHAKRIYFPIIKDCERESNVALAGIIDVVSEEEKINRFLSENVTNVPTCFVEPENFDRALITQFTESLNANCVIISTSPDSHSIYADWAIDNGLHILMDKPVTAVENSAHNSESAKKIHKEYIGLLKKLRSKRESRPDLVFEIMTQRRHHPAFKLMKSTIEEVYQKTSCPVTYYYGFHNDGQWRLPSEIRDLDYHGFTGGNGKASHSGYHFYDLLSWLTEGASLEKPTELLNVKSWANYPVNYVKQIDENVINKAFPGSIVESVFPKDFNNFGEVDVMSTIQLCSGGYVMTHAQIDLQHSGFSTRSWPSIDNRDIYKKNGRVRHEQHYINMGPFLAISLTSWQSKPFCSEDMLNKEIYSPGHEFNLDIDIFRNTEIIGGKPVESYCLPDIYRPDLQNYSRGHQEDARKNAVKEFFELISVGKNVGSSALESHILTSKIISMVYESLSNKAEVSSGV